MLKTAPIEYELLEIAKSSDFREMMRQYGLMPDSTLYRWELCTFWAARQIESNGILMNVLELDKMIRALPTGYLLEKVTAVRNSVRPNGKIYPEIEQFKTVSGSIEVFPDFPFNSPWQPSLGHHFVKMEFDHLTELHVLIGLSGETDLFKPGQNSDRVIEAMATRMGFADKQRCGFREFVTKMIYGDEVLNGTFNSAFPKIKEFYQSVIDGAQKSSYVYSFFGRQWKPGNRQDFNGLVFNYVLQSTVYDSIKFLISRLVDRGIKVVLPTHRGVIVEVKDGCELPTLQGPIIGNLELPVFVQE